MKSIAIESKTAYPPKNVRYEANYKTKYNKEETPAQFYHSIPLKQIDGSFVSTEYRASSNEIPIGTSSISYSN